MKFWAPQPVKFWAPQPVKLWVGPNLFLTLDFPRQTPIRSHTNTTQTPTLPRQSQPFITHQTHASMNHGPHPPTHLLTTHRTLIATATRPPKPAIAPTYSTPLHLSSATRIARHTPPTTNQILKTHQHQHRAGDTKRQTANRGTAPMMIISSQRSSMIGPQVSRALRIYERSEKSSGHLRWLLGRKSIVRSQRSFHLGG